jgi:hypothetical protein
MRAADAHYYQACLRCGARYQYDWKVMRRVGWAYRGQQKASAAVPSQANKNSLLRTAPGLKLLLEQESAHRVFLRNLVDLLWPSRPPQANTCRPGVFWRDVFIYPSVPWRRMLESVLYHTIAVAVVLILSQFPAQRTQQQARKPQPWYVVYYTSSQPFPTRGDRLRTSARSKRVPPAPRQAAIRVAQEHGKSSIRPPEIKLTAYRPLDITVSRPLLPAMPLSIAGRSHLVAPAGLSSVVAPPPESRGIAARWPALPQTSVILPSPRVGQNVSSTRAVNSLYAAVVAPPPAMPGTISRIAKIDIGSGELVGPAPQLSSIERPAIWAIAAMTTGIPGSSIVPPAPSVQGSDGLGHARASSTFGLGLPSASLAPSARGMVKSAASGPLVAMNTHPTATPPRPLPDRPREPAAQEVPVRLVGLALALPNSAYFSNTEVYIAERSIAKGETELIKLVYMSLPYQPRLSEYALNNATVYKLRVSRDQSCDETLLQMTWPENDSTAGRQNSTDHPVLSPSERNSVLPCYRTTADDYRKALSRGH